MFVTKRIYRRFHIHLKFHKNIVIIYKWISFNKEVFVKHEQAPTAPKLEGV